MARVAAMAAAKGITKAALKAGAKEAVKDTAKATTKTATKSATKTVAKQTMSRAEKDAAIAKGARKTQARSDSRYESAKPDVLAQRARTAASDKARGRSNLKDAIKRDAKKKGK